MSRRKSVQFCWGLSADSAPITLEKARKLHVSYLEKGPHIYIEENRHSGSWKILHSLSINQRDLKLLCDSAVEGIRLHFCREKSGHLNIIAVPIGKNGEAAVEPYSSTSLPPIVNTLEPCPTLCSPLFSVNNLNCIVKDDQYYWIDPNEKQDGKVWFRKGSDGKKVYVERPSEEPES